MKLIFSCFISLILLSSCSIVFAQNPTIDDAKDFRIEKLEGKELIVSFTVSSDFLSPRTVGLKVKKGKLFKNGEYYGSFKLADKIKISNKSNKDIKVRILVGLEKEINVMKEGIKALMGSPLELKMTGVFRTTWFIFWKRYPFEFQENVSLKNFMNK